LRTDLVRERSRHLQRLEKLLEDALIKLSSVATDIMGVSGRAMIEALIAGERDPHVLVALANGRLRKKRDRLVEALTGRFDDHHAELAQLLLDQFDALSAQIDMLTLRIEQLIAEIPSAQAPSSPVSHGDRRWAAIPEPMTMTSATNVAGRREWRFHRDMTELLVYVILSSSEGRPIAGRMSRTSAKKPLRCSPFARYNSALWSALGTQTYD